MNVNYDERLARCGRLMAKAGLDVLVLTRPANMFYLSGDGRLCAYVMVTRDGKVAIGVPATDVEDVKRQARFDEIEGFGDEVGMIHSLAGNFKRFGVSRGTVGLEYTFLTQSMMGMLTHPHAKPKEVMVADATPVLSELRLVKDEREIGLIQGAAAVADTAMAAVLRAVRPGVTESAVAAEAEYAMRQSGAEGFWRTYVSSGPRTNIAHGLPTGRRIEAGELVMIDLHPIVNGYSADLCRTVCVGEPTEAQEAAYELFRKAQQAAIGAIRAGAGVDELEKTLRGIIGEAGHGSHVFGPPVHGVGIEFEEAPLPSGHAFFHGEKAPAPLEAGTVIAVGNCGLYTGPWGVRIEDTVLVRQGDSMVMTSSPRSL